MPDSKLLKVYLLRHGQTTWNADNNRYCGRTDIDLTEKGIEQAKQVNEQLVNVSFDAVYSSPLKRAAITANIASNKEVVTDERLIELDFGNWEKKTRDEFVAEDPQSWEDWSQSPERTKAGRTGDTGMDVVLRVEDFFREMITKHPGGTILVVAHNGVNRLYLAYKLGMPLSNYRQLVQHNSSITFFTLDENGTLTLEYLNSKLK